MTQRVNSERYFHSATLRSKTEYNIKKIIYRNSQLLRDKQISINKFLNKDILQNGAGNGSNDLIITYKNIEYKYSQVFDDDHYILYSYDEFDCVSVIIFQQDHNAEIHGIGNFLQCLQARKSCIPDSNMSVGSTLLIITIKMLKKYKDIFGINKIRQKKKLRFLFFAESIKLF